MNKHLTLFLLFAIFLITNSFSQNIYFKNVNDSIQDADDLIKIYRQIPTHLINVIEYNPIDNASFTKPDDDTTQQFTDYLAKHRVNVRLRRSRGKDIDAACGQLANKK